MTGLFGRRSSKEEGARKKRNREAIKSLREMVRAKRYDEALGAGLRYLEGMPHNHDVLFIVGGIYYMRGEHRAALKYLDRAAEIGSYDVDVLLLKANSHHALGEERRAKECCDKILEVDEKNGGVRHLLKELDL